MCNLHPILPKCHFPFYLNCVGKMRNGKGLGNLFFMHRKIVLILNMKMHSGFEISNVPSSGFSVTLHNCFAAKITFNPVFGYFLLYKIKLNTTYINILRQSFLNDFCIHQRIHSFSNHV